MTPMASDPIDLDRLEADLDSLRRTYLEAEPFPHIVLDDVLDPEVFRQAVGEFPGADSSAWTNYLHVNERKFGNTDPESWGPTLNGVARALTSRRFVEFLERLTDHPALLADWSMDGGGLHRTPTGGHLNVHADFTAHHVHRNWRRRVNVLLYLNPVWEDDWGGGLELWERDMSRAVHTVRPTGNRVVIFTTSEDSYHGHPTPLSCPPEIARQSMALYYFEEQDKPLTRSTDYRARPGEGPKRVAIYLDKQALRAYDVLKRRLRLRDGLVSRGLGRLGGARRSSRTDD